MSNELVLVRIRATTETAPEDPLILGTLVDATWVDGGTALLASHGEDLEVIYTAEAPADRRQVARLKCLGSTGAEAAAALVPHGIGVLVDGQRGVGLRHLRPGNVLSIADAEYLLARRYQASPHPVPEALASCECPVCGLRLDEAPVASCQCGVRFHAAEPTSKTSLSCFTETPTCFQCQRPKTFEPTLLPEPRALGLGG